MNRSLRVASPLALVLFLACGDELPLDAYGVVQGPPNPEPGRCRHHDPLRSAWFGDLHVHTAFSPDSRQGGVRLLPDDAYRYAFGEPVLLPPLDEQGRGTREVRIDRPLDFAAVTDHGEFLGEMQLCTDPVSGVYDTDFCNDVRHSTVTDYTLALRIMTPVTWRDDETCDDDGARCRDAAAGTWKRIIQAAQGWNDETDACERTTFVGYEYSSHRLGSNLHRNVIFRNATVLARPLSYIETTREWELWRLLREQCIESGTGCDVLAIPHNSNISNGRMFALDYPGAGSLEEEVQRAALRASMEPVVEVMQHKGDSECRSGIQGIIADEDELCDFEEFLDRAVRLSEGESIEACYEGVFADSVPHLGPDCLSPGSYTRHALTLGLAEEARLGVNPFKFGLMASTDTHNATPGSVEERSYPGHLGEVDDTVAERVTESTEVRGNTNNNPGGLIGAWAEENARDSLFDAIRRREVFGTSGPRIQVRFFGGWDYDPGLCEDPQLVAKSYAGGVPMGGDLPGRPTPDDGPVFVAVAQRDPGTETTPGGLLQRIQIVKGWVDPQGALREKVYDVAGGASDQAGVDTDTCEVYGPGFDHLCAVWRDPDFDPASRAVYYSRVVENPSCRYSTWQCVELPPAQRPAACATSTAPRTIQERAWTSPIWYTPGS